MITNPKNEMLLLGSLMLHPQYLNEIDKYSLNIPDFSTKLNRYIFSAIHGLYSKGAKNITPIDIENYLHTQAAASAVFEQENGIGFIQDMLKLAQPENFPYYYKKLKKFNLLNDLAKNGFDISDFYIDDAFSEEAFETNKHFEDLELEDIVQGIKKKLLHLENKFQAGEEVEVESVVEGLDEFFAGLQSREGMGPSLQGDIFSEIIGGAKKKTLTIRSAASSVGKSRNAVGDSCYLAFPFRYSQEHRKWVREGHNEKVIYIVTEQSFDEIRKMILAYLTGINETKLKYWDLTQEEETLVIQARCIMEQFKDNLTLIKMPSPTIELVKTVVRENCLLTGAEYVFFDYIFISPSLLNEFKGYALRNDEVLLMFATALKDLAVELDICVFSSTQLNAKGDDNTDIRNEASLAGGRSTINKADYGCVMARPTKEELELLKQDNIAHSFEEPNLVTDMFKVRDGRWTQVRIWSYIDLGTLRKRDLFLTNSRLEPIEGFTSDKHFITEVWDENEKTDMDRFMEKLNDGEVDVRL